MSIHIVDEYCERLRPHSRMRRTLSTFSRQAEHDPRVAKMHLRALNRIAIAIVLDESEYAGQPFDGRCNILINEVREDNIGRYGAILHNVIL